MEVSGHNNKCTLHTILGDVARVNGQLAVSRAFGDKNLKTHLRSDPDVQNADVDSDTDILVLASDGLWKVINLSLSLSLLLTLYCVYLYGFFSINPGHG